MSTVPGSLPCSIRVRNLSRRYVSPKMSTYFPRLLDSQLLGTSARFSAQSVSMMPSVG